jgi:hypothetical protein
VHHRPRQHSDLGTASTTVGTTPGRVGDVLDLSTTLACLGHMLCHHACASDLFDVFTAQHGFGFFRRPAAPTRTSPTSNGASPDPSSTSSVCLQLDTTPAHANHDVRSRLHAKAKCLFQLNILTTLILVSVTFANLLYILFSAPFPSPFDTLGGLGVADLDTLGGLALPI